MYQLRDFLTSVLGMSYDDVVSDELYCSESNTRLTFLTNQMQETLAGYSYTLVHDGWLQLLYNDRMLVLKQGDLLIYSPGVQIRIINGSKNYHSACLMIDEQAALEIPGVRNVVHTAYQPIAELGRPVIHLNEKQASHFWQHMLEIIRYQHSIRVSELQVGGTDAKLVLEALREVGGGGEADFVGHFGDVLIGGQQQLATFLQTCRAEQFYG